MAFPVVFFALCIASSHHVPFVPDEPNVVVFMAPLCGEECTQKTNANQKVSNMERIGREGARFARGYAAGGASRMATSYSIMSGRTPSRSELRSVVTSESVQDDTLQSKLQSYGFVTIQSGRFDAVPNTTSKDVFASRIRASGFSVANPTEGGDHNKMLDSLKSVEYAVKNGKPFYLHMSAGKLDDPSVNPEASLDRLFGSVLKGLEHVGVLDRTIVILCRTADGMNGVSEDAARMELSVRYPEEVGAGTTVQSVSLSTDIYSSVLDFMGVDDSAVVENDGESWRNEIGGGHRVTTRPKIIEAGLNRAVRVGDLKLVDDGVSRTLYNMTYGREEMVRRDTVATHEARKEMVAYLACYDKREAGCTLPAIPNGMQ